MAERYLLDTSTVSDIIVENDIAIRHLRSVPSGSVSISTISEAELLFGALKRNRSKPLAQAINAFLRRVAIVSWDSHAAAHYAELRFDLESAGTPLSALDMLIAAQAIATGATLVSSDRAFRRIKSLAVVDWRKA